MRIDKALVDSLTQFFTIIPYLTQSPISILIAIDVLILALGITP